MATTDQDVLTQMQYALVETPNGGASISSGLWTTDEFINAINNAQQWVIEIGRVRYTRLQLVTVPNVARFDLPQDWLLTRRVAWENADGEWSELPRDASWTFDYGDLTWTYDLSPAPIAYTDVDTPIPMLQVMPAASDNGLLHILYAALPTSLSNTGVEWSIPDMCVPMAKWKAIAILLAKDGRGQDLPRAQMANARADEGMAALKLYLHGWQ